MYAVVRSGGKQLKVETDSVALVEKIDVALGESITLPAVFFSDGDTVVTDAAGLASVIVTAEVVEQVRDEKVVVFKFKKRKGYKRTRGHRQALTRIRVTDISVGGKKAKKTATTAKPSEETTAGAEEATAKKAAPAKKPAAKKPAAKKPAEKAAPKATSATKAAEEKPAAKKPAAKKPATKSAGAEKTATKTGEAKPAAKKPAAKKPAAKPAEKKTTAKKPAAKKPADKAE